METSERLYHVVAINERTGRKERLTAYRDTHAACVTILSKQVPYPGIRKQLEDAPMDDIDIIIATARKCSEELLATGWALRGEHYWIGSHVVDLDTALARPSTIEEREDMARRVRLLLDAAYKGP